MGKPKVEKMEIAKTNPNAVSKQKFELDIGGVKITSEDVKRWIAPPNTSDADLYMFMAACAQNKLNPFPYAGQIYFAMINGRPTPVVGQQTYLRRAEATGLVHWWGISEIKEDENGKYMEFQLERNDRKDTLPDGTVEYRMHTWPVYFNEFERKSRSGKPTTWDKMPIHMHRIRTAVVGFRQFMSVECGELPYTEEELAAYRIGDVQNIPRIRRVFRTDDIDELRKAYFATADELGVFTNEDDRHKWQKATIGKESVTEWTIEDFNQALDSLDYLKRIKTPFSTPEEVDSEKATESNAIDAEYEEVEMEVEEVEVVQEPVEPELFEKVKGFEDNNPEHESGGSK